jgi:hypothetical protein
MNQYGSLQNDIRSRQVIGQPEPYVGMGATILSYSDRSAGTIVAAYRYGKHRQWVITVRVDDAVVVSGSEQDGSAEYEYRQRGYGAPEYMFRQLADGKWEGVSVNPETGRYVKAGYGGLAIGRREQYRDPHF